MTLNELILIILFSVAMLCIFTDIGMTFYLGRGKMKKIDRLVYGYEIPSDSIFFQLLRIPQYGGAFASLWLAKRTHLLYLHDHFDKKFQRPFIISFYLMLISGVFMVLAIILNEFFL